MEKLFKVAFLITIGIVSANILSAQSYFIEPEIGFYKPSDNDFEGDKSLRFGGNVGLSLQNGIQAYGGYNLWSNEYDDVDGYGDPITLSHNANFFKVGGSKIIKLHNSPVNLRFGGELLYSFFKFEHDDKYYDSSDYTTSSSGIGLAIEGGVLFNVGGIQLFAGLNYLMVEVEYDEIEYDGRTYSPNELGIGKDESQFEGNGTTFKVSAIFPF